MRAALFVLVLALVPMLTACATHRCTDMAAIRDARAADQEFGPDWARGGSAGDAAAIAAPDAPTDKTAPSRAAKRTPVRRTLVGKASYYHDSLAGNHTANGEIYDPRKMTAASRDLPFGTMVRVVRVDTGKAVVVRVNDRGPFGKKERILDLSRAAAEALDMIRAGVVSIRAEVLRTPE